jgi:hypothetical protein
MKAVTIDRARAAKVKVVALLDGLAELQAIGIAMLDDGFGVKVNLWRKPADGIIPAEVDGVPVIVEIVGPIAAL